LIILFSEIKPIIVSSEQKHWLDSDYFYLLKFSTNLYAKLS
jgi:hypothetical protein